jgi:protein TonB
VNKPTRRVSPSTFVYGASVVFHVALATGAIFAPKPKKVETVAISLSEQKKKEAEKKEEPPPPPPPPPKEPERKAKAAPRMAAKAEPPPPTNPNPPPPSAANAMDGFADLGLSMGNGPGGLAVPTGPRSASPTASPTTTATQKVQALAPKREDTCDESPIKPKPTGIVKPAYTEDARQAQVEGVVRVEVTVDDQGRVIQARVLKGLGHGLDEAALAAVKKMTFAPGTRCGKPSVATLSLSMRFSLGS